MSRILTTPARRRLTRAGVVTTALAACAAGAVATAAAATATTISPGATLARSAVPWKQVGHGWTLDTWAPKANSAHTQLLLVSSGGTRYRIATLGRYAEPLVWSPNGRLAFVEGARGTMLVNLASGHRTKIRHHGRPMTFTPNSKAYISEVDVPHGQYLVPTLRRYSVGGRLQATFPGHVKGDGSIDTLGAVVTSDGRLVVGSRHGVVVFRHDGAVQRRLAVTRGYCTVSGWWGRGTVQASCGKGVVYALPLNGTHPTALTAGPGKHNPFGYSEVWNYSQGRLGLAPNGCGPESLVKFDGHGHGRRITVPSPNSFDGTRSIVGHDGDVVTLTVQKGGACEPQRTLLYAWDAKDKTNHVLLGAGANGGTVLGALPYAKDE